MLAGWFGRQGDPGNQGVSFVFNFHHMTKETSLANTILTTFVESGQRTEVKTAGMSATNRKCLVKNMTRKWQNMIYRGYRRGCPWQKVILFSYWSFFGMFIVWFVWLRCCEFGRSNNAALVRSENNGRTLREFLEFYLPANLRSAISDTISTHFIWQDNLTFTT